MLVKSSKYQRAEQVAATTQKCGRRCRLPLTYIPMYMCHGIACRGFIFYANSNLSKNVHIIFTKVSLKNKRQLLILKI